jgi:hypothetical protein
MFADNIACGGGPKTFWYNPASSSYLCSELGSLAYIMVTVVAIGTMTQTRVFGGVVGLAVCQIIILSRLQSQLSQHLTPQQLQDILFSATNINSLSPALAEKIRQVYGDAANFQMRIAMGISVASLVVGLFMWRQKPIPFSESSGRGTESIEMGPQSPDAS